VPRCLRWRNCGAAAMAAQAAVGRVRREARTDVATAGPRVGEADDPEVRRRRNRTPTESSQAGFARVRGYLVRRTRRLEAVHPPSSGDTWVGLGSGELPVAAALQWVNQPSSGAVVLFSGNARDHSTGRSDVTVLEYEAYESQVEPRLAAVAAEARVRWPDVGRLVLLHRVGVVEIGAAAVIVLATAPHRGAAFDAARFCIDTLKASVPIWKRETWSGGESWGLEAQHIIEAGAPSGEAGSSLDGGGRTQEEMGTQ
jgi:molybdopterin synthase catalytic subunit